MAFFKTNLMRGSLWMVVASMCISVVPLQAVASAPNVKALGEKIMRIDQTYPQGAIATAPVADAAISLSGSLNQELVEWYLEEQNDCYTKFFVNRCLDQARLARRNHLTVLQRVVVEAKAVKRRLHIEELDRDLESKRSPTKP